MLILSHRGWWLEPDERNTTRAFERSFAAGFGTELDLRDRDGELVVSHDPPVHENVAFHDVLDLHASIDPELRLAINVKADGLQGRIGEALASVGARDHFVFDMSVPDTLAYRAAGMPYYTRHSELEQAPALYDDAAGVWLDAFFGEWFNETVVEAHLKAEKRVCIVSPELHGRPHESAWQQWASWPCISTADIAICTDHPDAAAEAFSR